MEKLLEDAQIKLPVVASDIFGMPGRRMLEAMTGGQRDPGVLAQLAHGRMRSKISRLEEALTGHFDYHHAFLCQMMLDRVDDITRQVGELTTRIEEQIAPFADAADRLDEIPGVGRTGAQELIAEIGVDMTRFPDAAAWCPGLSSRRSTGAPPARRKAPPPERETRGSAPPSARSFPGAARTNTFLAERYQRIARRRGKRRAIVAVGNSVLTIVWHVLSDPEATYHDLGPGYYESRISSQRRQRALIRQLEQLTGQKVALQPAA